MQWVELPCYDVTRIRFGVFALFCMMLPQHVFAHGGGLDANGCHTKRKTGEYHCHRARGNAAPVPRRKNPARAQRSQIDGCGAKYYCKEMDSCREAMHYMRVCGLIRLDGDGDGVPCENICGTR